MKEVVAGVIAFVLIAGLSIWYEVTVWRECRQTNSVLYCVRVMG